MLMTHEVKGAGARVRFRLRHRLAERQITNRAFGKRLGHGDQWVSNLLAGRFTLSLDDLDEAAKAVEMQPSDLVRHDGEEAWVLTPSEMRLVRAVRNLPVVLRDQLRAMAEYMMGTAPEEIDFLKEFRALDAEDQERVRQSVSLLRLRPVSEPRTRSTPGMLAAAREIERLTRGRKRRKG